MSRGYNAGVKRTPEERKVGRPKDKLRQKYLKPEDMSIRKIKVDFTGKFFGFVLDRKVFHADNCSYLKLPKQMAGKTYTIIIIKNRGNDTHWGVALPSVAMLNTVYSGYSLKNRKRPIIDYYIIETAQIQTEA